MQTELSFIIFMMLLFATAVIFLWLMTRSKNKQCNNCCFFTLRKESTRLATAFASSTTISSGNQPASTGSVNQISIRRSHNINE